MWSKQRHFWAHLSTGIIFTFARPCYVSQWGKIVSSWAFDSLHINQKIVLPLKPEGKPILAGVVFNDVILNWLLLCSFNNLCMKIFDKSKKS